MSLNSDSDDFYVVDDCCIKCGMLERVAPQLFKLGDSHCFMLRQPKSTGDFDKAVHAMWAADANCVRYRGRDMNFLRRLAENGLENLADDASAQNFEYVLRDHVVFRASLSPFELADAFRQYLSSGQTTEMFVSRRKSTTVEYGWSKGIYHPVSFRQPLEDGRCLAVVETRAVGYQSVKLTLDAWLREVRGFSGIVWCSEQELEIRTGVPGPF